MATKPLPWSSSPEATNAQDPKLPVKCHYVENPTTVAARLFLQVQPACAIYDVYCWEFWLQKHLAFFRYVKGLCWQMISDLAG